MWLEDPSLGVLPLDLAHGYIVTSFDPGFPEARVLQDNRVVAPGAVDRTASFGARSVTVAVSVREGTAPGFESRRRARERLQAFCAPGRHPVLFFDEENDGELRMIRLSARSAASSIERPGSVTVPCQWSAPEGIIEAARSTSARVSAVAQGQPGVTFPITFPFSFPAGTVVGTTVVSNGGTAPAAPVFDLWGPCTDPVLELVSTGDRIVFRGLSLSETQFVRIDVRNPTPLLNGRLDEPLTAFVAWESTDFFWLPPGTQRLRYTPATYGDAAYADISWRDSWT